MKDEESSKNPLAVAEALSKELRDYDVINNRKQVLDILRDRFVASTMETASQKQRAETLVIEKLIDKIENDNLNPSMLLRILENVSKSNNAAIESIIGEKSSSQGKGVDVIINNNPQGGATINAKRVEEGDEVQHPMKDANTLLEAMNIISKTITDRKGIIDSKPINSGEDEDGIIDIDPE